MMSITVFQSFISSITDTDDSENKMDLNWTEKTLKCMKTQKHITSAYE